MPPDNRPALAVIGAGAIAEIFHLPALARRPDLAARALVVDRDAERARLAAATLPGARAATDYRAVLDEVQGAIVAVPLRLHRDVTQECLRRGVHVLCEKPLTETAADAAEMAALAEREGLVLSVNNTRRLYPSTRAVRALIEGGRFGSVVAIDFEEGDKFGWPAVGDGYFGVRAGGRGVLADVGAHVVDLVCWWLGETPRLESYQDDALGGTEAVCELRLATGTATARVRLSWLSKLRNGYRIRFASGHVVEHGIYDWRRPTLISPDGRREVIETAAGPPAYPRFADQLLDNFVAAMSGGEVPLVPAREVLPSLTLIDRCYQQRRRFAMPWFTPPELDPGFAARPAGGERP